jgi:hypothetical protein
MENININMDMELSLDELEAVNGGFSFSDLWDMAKREIPELERLEEMSEDARKSANDLANATKLLIDHPELILDVF